MRITSLPCGKSVKTKKATRLNSKKIIVDLKMSKKSLSLSSRGTVLPTNINRRKEKEANLNIYRKITVKNLWIGTRKFMVRILEFQNVVSSYFDLVEKFNIGISTKTEKLYLT